MNAQISKYKYLIIVLCLNLFAGYSIAVAASPELVTFPNQSVAFIIGPQLKSGNSLNPWPWFDQNAITSGLKFAGEYPAFPPAATPGAGTVSVVKGNATVTGTNTQFISEYPYTGSYIAIYIADENGVRFPYRIVSVEDDTHMTIAPAYGGWDEIGGSGRLSYPWSEADSNFWSRNYYDLGYTQYINYYRTGDQRFLDLGRKVADSMWIDLDYGKQKKNAQSPRGSSLNALIMRAMDGKPEMWPYIEWFVREQYNAWLGQRISYQGLWYGVRDGGYMLLYAAELAKVHPDAAVREEFRQKAITAAVDYFARLQNTDGSWRWGDDWDYDGDVDAQDGTKMSAFMVGILLEGMAKVHQFDDNGIQISPTDKQKIGNSITKAVDNIYTYHYNQQPIAELPTIKWRGMYYAVYDLAGNPVCVLGCGLSYNNDGGNILSVRQHNSLIVHAFGYAYHITGNSKYKTWGDELFDASYGGGDGYRTLASYDVKNYSQAYRTGGTYLAWRMDSGSVDPVDTTPPIISEISLSTTQTDSIIQWNTDEASDSQVEYGLTNSYGSNTVLDKNMTVRHSRNLSLLVPDTTYNYRVKSRDATGNIAISADQTFTTASLSTPPSTTSPNLNVTTADFSNISVGNKSQPFMFAVNNPLNYFVGISNVKVTGDFLVTTNQCSSGMQPSTYCNIYVIFTPTKSGNRTGTLTITPISTLTSKQFSTLSATLTGTGITVNPSNTPPITPPTLPPSPPSITPNPVVTPPQTIQPIIITKVLARGMTSPYVIILQNHLKQLGLLDISIETTSYFGPATEAAVKRYQASKNIEQTGTVGPLTRASLAGSSLSTLPTQTTTSQVLPKTVYLGMQHPDVVKLQNILKRLGFFPQSVASSGYFGSETKKAVKKFQKTYGIASGGTESTTGYGMVGKITWTKLLSL